MDARAIETNSADFYWYSNLLEERLAGRRADVIAWPTTPRELAGTLAVAYDLGAPVTVRGGGTGNYGQAVPLFGGLVVNTLKMGRVLEVGDGFARVEAGVKFPEMDAAAAPTGQESRIFPSTYLMATVAGFVCGGSGGIGSTEFGSLYDGNLLAATVFPVNADPRPITATGDGLSVYMHGYGTTGVVADVTVPLAPKRDWEQASFAFPGFVAAHEFAVELIHQTDVPLRMISTSEASVVAHFARSNLPFTQGRDAVLLIFERGRLADVTRAAERFGGELDFTIDPQENARKRLIDYSWNHTTLWAKRSSKDYTYLQTGMDLGRFAEQYRAVKAEYGDDYQFHCEYTRWGGAPSVGAMPIVPYRGEESIAETIDFLGSVGIGVANPHTWVLEDGGLVDGAQALLRAKRENDPRGLLNPGKLRAAFTDDRERGRAFPTPFDRKANVAGVEA
ncbi:MAG: FAD-binding oxidoreductase [Planctomycetota bacterium]